MDAPMWEVITGDCREVLRALPAESIDAVVTDPPYGLSFLDASWDHGVPSIEYWTEILRVTKPGAYLVAFGGTRTHHRLMCAIEDATWELRDCLMWLYGQGYPKHASHLKPAWEPIVLARRAGPIVPLNIDACRIPSVGGGVERAGEVSADRRYATSSADFSARPGPRGGDGRGRWPANVVLDEEAARLLDDQTGTLTSGLMKAGTQRSQKAMDGSYRGGFPGEATSHDTIADSGGASRFYYVAKASTEERTEGGDIDNEHPTVKPVELMRWLCKLVTPVGGRILDPFCGSGSTGVAAVTHGFAFTGIDLVAEYAETARRRIEIATRQRTIFDLAGWEHA